jgi:hypothetical protein
MDKEATMISPPPWVLIYPYRVLRQKRSTLAKHKVTAPASVYIYTVESTLVGFYILSTTGTGARDFEISNPIL